LDPLTRDSRVAERSAKVMTNARSRTPEEYIRNTVRRWGRGRILLVGVIGALVILAIGVISAAALVGLPTLPTRSCARS
jgi:preprotein translocase subunit Sss1